MLRTETHFKNNSLTWKGEKQKDEMDSIQKPNQKKVGVALLTSKLTSEQRNCQG